MTIDISPEDELPSIPAPDPEDVPPTRVTLAEHFAINYRVLENLLTNGLTNKTHIDNMRERLVQVALNLTLFEAQRA
jgi:hypothetical protein